MIQHSTYIDLLGLGLGCFHYRLTKCFQEFLHLKTCKPEILNCCCTPERMFIVQFENEPKENNYHCSPNIWCLTSWEYNMNSRRLWGHEELPHILLSFLFGNTTIKSLCVIPDEIQFCFQDIWRNLSQQPHFFKLFAFVRLKCIKK